MTFLFLYTSPQMQRNPYSLENCYVPVHQNRQDQATQTPVLQDIQLHIAKGQVQTLHNTLAKERLKNAEGAAKLEALAKLVLATQSADKGNPQQQAIMASLINQAADAQKQGAQYKSERDEAVVNLHAVIAQNEHDKKTLLEKLAELEAQLKKKDEQVLLAQNNAKFAIADRDEAIRANKELQTQVA